MEYRVHKALHKIANGNLSLKELESLKANAVRIGNASAVVEGCDLKINELRKKFPNLKRENISAKNNGVFPGFSRKQFIESLGATCKNWTWSWSFVNYEEKFVIFGEWDIYQESCKTLIFNEDWAISRKGKKQPGYPQSREHIRLIEQEGFSLKTYQMIYAPADDNDPGAPAKIIGFKPVLHSRKLVRDGKKWFAVSFTE